MSTPTIARKIVDVLAARAAKIRVASGYNTDAGRTVLIAVPTLDRTQIPAVVIYPSEAIVDQESSGGRVKWTRLISIDAMAQADPSNPGVIAEDLLGDLQKAILDPDDKRLGGLAMDMTVETLDTAPRDDGGTVAGATMEVAVTYVTGYGDPYQ